MGVRDIFRRIGETIANNGEVKIAFSVGNLRVRKRRLDFDFDLQKISPVRSDLRESSYFSISSGPFILTLMSSVLPPHFSSMVTYCGQPEDMSVCLLSSRTLNSGWLLVLVFKFLIGSSCQDQN